ncbi:uncharacterized protein CMU_028500 [Cryptosporidium muris RN66]|uniref:AAA+ ATPase domain-containing protein n=1 Tax=Cryptosporidium muris (strain RN66) TaxID=441375 RepID=B6AHT5_CRYMR|nr:uncharacterized protein CMU_028500 [Cryptosporidium muris RN66]EEA07776.1 hypothetical protein, conserved [Cryptosporidium muris RN66]|eukprot:XP_002142125.1 hypothetical protein [Cryptosporidium muris RN66]
MINTLVRDPFLSSITTLNRRLWVGYPKDVNSKDISDDTSYILESDVDRLYKIYASSKVFLRKCGKFTKLEVFKIFMQGFMNNYIKLFVLQLLLILVSCYFTYYAKSFFLHTLSCDSKRDLKVGLLLLSIQIVQIFLSTFTDYYREGLQVRVRGAIILLCMKNLINSQYIDVEGVSLAKIQSLISVDGEFSEYSLSYGVDLILLPLNVMVTLIFAKVIFGGVPLLICSTCLLLFGSFAILSQYISSSYKRPFLDYREARVAEEARLLSHSSDIMGTNQYLMAIKYLINGNRRLEMYYNGCRKYWFAIGDVACNWMSIICALGFCIYGKVYELKSVKVATTIVECAYFIPTYIKPLSLIAYLVYYLTEANNSLNRISNLFNCILEYSDPLGDKITVINSKQCSNLHLSYISIEYGGNSPPVILRPGMLTLLVGESKSGKSSFLLNLIRSNKYSKSKLKMKFKVVFRDFNYSKNNNSKRLSKGYNLKILEDNSETDHNLWTSSLEEYFEIYYVPQSIWVPDGLSLKDTILCGRPYDEDLWNKTIDVCCLQPDFEQLGLTKIENPLEYKLNLKQLSMGQKARLSIARAIYDVSLKLNPIFLFDNVLIYLDTKVRNNILFNLFNRESGVFRFGCGIIAIEPHMIDSTLVSLKSKISSCNKLLVKEVVQHYNKLELVTSRTTNKNVILSYLNSRQVHSSDNSCNMELSKHELAFVNIYNIVDNCIIDANYLDIQSIPDESSTNVISYEDEIADSGTCLGVSDMVVKCLDKSTLRFNSNLHSPSIYWYYLFKAAATISYSNSFKGTQSDTKRNFLFVNLFITLLLLPAIFYKISEYCLVNVLANPKSNYSEYLFKVHFYIYCGSNLFLLATSCIKAFLEVYLGQSAARYTHDTLISGYLGTNSNLRTLPSSLIFNRLSTDQLIIDYCATKRIGQVVQHLNKVIIASIMAAFASSYPAVVLGIIICVSLIIYLKYVRYFINSCKSLRFCYQTEISSLINTASTITEGILCIRCQRFNHFYTSKTTQQIKAILIPLYGQVALDIWLRLRLDLYLSIPLNIFNILLSSFFGSQIPLTLGLALSTALSVPKYVSSIVQYWSKMEIELVAVSRVREYLEQIESDNFEYLGKNETSEFTSKYTPEISDPNNIVEFKDVYCCYYKLILAESRFWDEALGTFTEFQIIPCIKGLTSKLYTGDTVAIIGRTGSGKTSILRFIAGILKPCCGKAVIKYGELSSTTNIKEKLLNWGLDLRTVEPSVSWNIFKNLERTRYIAYLPIKVYYPQKMTIKRILDPNNIHQDENIISVLNICRLKLNIKFENMRSSQIDCTYPLMSSESIQNQIYIPLENCKFSDNQLRILTFAGFILNRLDIKILLIDEPPIIREKSNIIDTDSYLLPSLIREYFSHCVVFIAAHEGCSLVGMKYIWLVSNGNIRIISNENL